MTASCKAIVVGAGGISPAWFNPLAAEQVEVAAVVDLDVQRAASRIAEFKLTGEPSDDLPAMIRKHRPDFVVDLTVPDAHCPVTCKALGLGCHVIGEKPMAATMAQARRMVKASEKSGKLYMVSQSRRWDVQHDAARRLLSGGAIGPLTAINCDFYIGAHFGGFRDRMASPLILDMAIHHFDLARYLTGADPLTVYTHEFNPAGSWYAGAAAATCIFQMSDGIVFSYRGSWCAEGCHTSWNGDWRIIGARGTILMEKGQPPRGQAVAGDEGFHRPLKGIEPSGPPLEFTGMRASLRQMLEFLRTGRKPQTECHDNIKSLAMVLAAIDSAKKGRRVAVQNGH